MSDKATDLIDRGRLSDLVHASMQSDVDPSVTAAASHTIPRSMLPHLRTTARSQHAVEPATSISPLAVFLVVAMFVMLFVAIVQLS